jgi:polysaccharide chain length determinant protein (PEP-CTERM system associated)
MIPGKTYTPDDVQRALSRRKWIIIFPFILISLGAAYYAYSLPNRFRSETLILVVPQRIPETYVRSTVTSRIEDRLRSISEQILSRSRLEPIIRDFGLYVDMRERVPMEDVVAAMRSQVTIATVRGDSFRVSFTSGDPVVAMKVTERLAGMFIDENLRDREVQATGTNEFLEKQLEGARQRLLEHERRLEVYRRKNSGELPSQLQANLATIVSQRQQLQSVAESINRDRDRRLMLEKSLGDLSAGQPSETASAAPADAAKTEATPEQKLAAARENLRSLTSRFKPDHPDVVATRRLVEQLEHEVDGTGPAATLPRPGSTESARRARARQVQNEIDTIDRQIAAKEAEVAKLRTQVDEYQRRVDAAPTRETEMTELMRDYETLKNVYTSLLAKKEDSKLAKNLEIAQAGEQFKILDPARVPEKPFSPNRPQIMTFGAIIGLCMGFGFAALLELRDSTVRTEDEIVRLLALPVVAMVPLMRTNADRRRARHRSLAAGAAGLLVVALAGAAVAWKMGILG